MECEQRAELTDREYIRKFSRKATDQRIPLFGSIDITHRCNLKCIHCYMKSSTDTKKNTLKELNTDQWKTIIDEITEAGCLFLLISGGEPLLRQDFTDIYLHAKKNGLLVTVFTNGTLINNEILELFDQFPPKAVEISLYGATSQTYENITGIKGSFKRCLTGIRSLIDHKINSKLKTILMTLNRHEYFDIENMAKELGVKFRFDPAIFPRLNGDQTPITLRVNAEDAIEIEFSDETRFQEWKDFFNRMKDIPTSDKLYQCGAGLSTFHIDPFANLQPCMMVSHVTYSILEGDFSTGWNEIIPRMREKKPRSDFPCHQCKERTLCGFCPGFFQLESGEDDRHSEYLCALGKHRFKKLNNNLSGGQDEIKAG